MVLFFLKIKLDDEQDNENKKCDYFNRQRYKGYSNFCGIKWQQSRKGIQTNIYKL